MIASQCCRKSSLYLQYYIIQQIVLVRSAFLFTYKAIYYTIAYSLFSIVCGIIKKYSCKDKFVMAGHCRGLQTRKRESRVFKIHYFETVLN